MQQKVYIVLSPSLFPHSFLPEIPICTSLVSFKKFYLLPVLCVCVCVCVCLCVYNHIDVYR